MLRHGIPTARTAVFSNRTDARNYIESLAEAPCREGGRADRRQRGVRLRFEGGGARGDRLDDGRGGGVRGGRPHRAHRGAPHRARGLRQGLHGRPDVGPDAVLLRLQAGADGDEGPNTGGMGAYSPPLWLDEASSRPIHREITEAAVAAMAAEGLPYRGVLYPGLMITADGPKGDRVQLPLRRPGDAGAAPAPQVRPAGDLLGRRQQPPPRRRDRVVGAGLRRRRHGLRRLPGRLRDRLPHRRPGLGRARTSSSSTPGRRWRTTAASSPAAAACSPSSPRARPAGGAREGLPQRPAHPLHARATTAATSPPRPRTRAWSRPRA